jgi:hypothetical protein
VSVVVFPKIDPLLDYYRRMVEILEAAGRNLHPILGGRAGEFRNMTQGEFDAALQDARDELDAQSTMMIIASAEAILKRDCRQRLLEKDRRNKLWLGLDALREAEAAAGYKGVRTAKLLAVWKSVTAHQLKQMTRLFEHRNWLAHGRFYTDKSGVVADPEQVVLVIKDSFAKLTAYQSDFPRS